MSAGNLVDVPGRRRTAGGLVGVAVLLAVLALALSYLGRAVLRPGPFADRAVAALRDAAVQDDVADHLTDAVTRLRGGDLVAVRPLVRSVAGEIVGGQAFAALFRRAILGAGLYILYRGVAAAATAVTAAARKPPQAAARVRRCARLAPAAVAVAAIAIAIASAIIISGGGDEAPAVTPVTCDGFVKLCNRPLNDVALAATHNSMASVTLPHGLFGQQDGTIRDQLDKGIHGLLIDTYYGFDVPSRVRTDLQSLPKRNIAEQEIGAPAVDAALRIRSRLPAGTGGKRGIALCQGFCELGSVTLASALADRRSFLVSNPGEVVVVINQDEGVSPTDIQRAFEKAGLLDLVYRGPLGPFPTLREMIDSNQRLVVMAENDAGQVPWYHLAYEQALQETPFRFTSAAQLTDSAKLDASCRPNRGPSSAPLFLLNNWVDTTPTPRPSLAAIVNARAALLRRAQTCQRIRGHLPNLVAVDFYRRGDVSGVVNAPNGVSR
ncbi:MAG: hypothetical protein WBP81_03180 [Solirubrobacteraceae bacterium]